MKRTTQRGPVEPQDGASAALDTEVQQQIEEIPDAKRWQRQMVERP